MENNVCIYIYIYTHTLAPDGDRSKEVDNARGVRDIGSIPGSGRSPGGGNDNRCSILALRIPRTKEPGGLQTDHGHAKNWT